MFALELTIITTMAKIRQMEEFTINGDIFRVFEFFRYFEVHRDGVEKGIFRVPKSAFFAWTLKRYGKRVREYRLFWVLLYVDWRNDLNLDLDC